MNSEDKDFTRLSIEQARKSVKEGGFPAGAIIVKDGKIISRGISVGSKIHDPSGHARLCFHIQTRNPHLEHANCLLKDISRNVPRPKEHLASDFPPRFRGLTNHKGM